MRKLQTHDRYQKSSINPLWQIYRLIRFPKVFKQTLIIEICRVMPNLKLKNVIYRKYLKMNIGKQTVFAYKVDQICFIPN